MNANAFGGEVATRQREPISPRTLSARASCEGVSSRRQSRPTGFTLIELVVVTCILAILSSITLGGLQNAARASRRDTTKFVIQKLNDAIMSRWEQYEDLAIQMNPTTTNNKLNKLRRIICEEMPDTWEDVPDSREMALTPAGQAYADYKNTPPSPSAAYAGAECLYMIITQSGMFPDFLEHIRPDRVGDIDQDGKLEFWDGWRRPISFIRWAPGFSSPLQEKDAVTAHDPLDPNEVDATAFALFPLIYSPGPDASLNDPLSDPSAGYGLVSLVTLDADDLKWRTSPALTGSNSPCTYKPPRKDSYTPVLVGAPDPANLDACRDNITNHDLLTR
jgi:prepilin-type N-terminal cleavage/methylation domain-containing protein